jgi:hypothetical protein
MVRLILSPLEVVKELYIVQDLRNVLFSQFLYCGHCPISDFILNILEPGCGLCPCKTGDLI